MIMSTNSSTKQKRITSYLFYQASFILILEPPEKDITLPYELNYILYLMNTNAKNPLENVTN